MNEEELKEEVELLKREIQHLKMEKLAQSQGITKKNSEKAGDMTDVGVFEEEISKTDFSNGFSKEKVKTVSYFSTKGHRLNREKVYRCSICKSILTDIESIEINNRIYCENCYRKKANNLDKDDFKVLLCIHNNFTSTSILLERLGIDVTIQRVTGLTKSEVINKLEKLMKKGYLFYYGLIFKKIRVKSKGEEALIAYNQIYQQDEDCNLVKSRLHKRWTY